MNIYGGDFIGRKTPNEDELLHSLRSGLVVIDTNIWISFYTLPIPLRKLAITHIERIQEQLWVPHQVVRELWRRRADQIRKSPFKGDFKSDLTSLFYRGLRDRAYTPDTDNDVHADKTPRVAELINQLAELRREHESQFEDWKHIGVDPSSDPVLRDIARLLEGRVGETPEDESAMIDRGLDRFSKKIPPGYLDGPKKKDQIPERGTGDYLIWQQTLNHAESVGIDAPIVIATHDEKEDWRWKENGTIIGAHPELVVEAYAKVGQPVFIVSPNVFYKMLAKLDPTNGTENELEELIIATNKSKSSASEDERAVDDETDEERWTYADYEDLLAWLTENGYISQHDVIRAASATECEIDRAGVYEVAGYDPRRSLKRFATPSDRFTRLRIEEGLLDELAPYPLRAFYSRPGKAEGYRVPQEFEGFEERYNSRMRLATDGEANGEQQ